ncbi:MAG TPA: hypothetical protein VHM90_16820 [Phycisphaerae bacterium]|jgi:hypothetical protein|nr:hypothetical protein [Phycisphaerae bacterium]
MTLKSLVLTAATLTTLGLGTAAARADGYVVTRSGGSYAPAYVSAPAAYVAAQGYYGGSAYAAPAYSAPVYSAPRPVYVPAPSYAPTCGPVYRPPVCEPPVVIYRPPVECREPVRVYRPYEHGRDWREGVRINFHW